MDRDEILAYASRQITSLKELEKGKQISLDDRKIYELVLEWTEKNMNCTSQDVKNFLENVRMIIETEIEIRSNGFQTNCIWLTK
ncbi:hypothetical protein AALH30_18620 [Blautia pseudococcoides]|uniref:hypothetical protein n=1 Tax=Blautia pseudococcoides TaxID=1796616 RepID=UPI00148B0CE1|nr:hypothetical protein [Blautia pseudococcoides]QJU17549.1 hypothetical protein HL650_25990 [Blautia pseudococcoides]